jgi:hypothetical protein
MIDAVGRRRLLISMALGMCIVLVCEAITVALGGEKAGIAAVFFVFLFEGCFTWGTFHVSSSIYTKLMLIYFPIQDGCQRHGYTPPKSSL